MLLIAATVIAYSPALNGTALWDDDAHITRPELRSLHGLSEIWTRPDVTQQYYPVTHSVFWLEQKLWGDNLFLYHLLNVALHLASAFLLLRILSMLAIPGAWFAAAIFALHPVQVESVAWISELKNTLSAVFCLSAALMYLRFDQSRRLLFYFAAFGLFLLGLGAKTTIAPLPGALLVIFWWKRSRLSLKQDVLPLIPFFIAGIGAGLFTAWVEHNYIGAEGSDFSLSIVERCLIAGRAFWFYLSKLFWPHDLIFVYPRWHVNQAIWWQYLFPLLRSYLPVFSGSHETRHAVHSPHCWCLAECFFPRWVSLMSIRSFSPLLRTIFNTSPVLASLFLSPLVSLSLHFAGHSIVASLLPFRSRFSLC